MELEKVDIFKRFASELVIDTSYIESQPELLHLAKQAVEIKKTDSVTYISTLLDEIKPLLSEDIEVTLPELRRILQNVYANLDCLTDITADYLTKQFPIEQSYLYFRQEGGTLLPEIVAEAMHIVCSDWVLLQDMKVHGFNPSALDRLIQELANDAIAVATRLKRNAFEKINALTLPAGGNHEAVKLGSHPEYLRFVMNNTLDDGQTGVQNGLIGIVLAGGRSTRLRTTIPKALICVGEKSLIDHTIDGLCEAGATKIFVSVGHRSEIFKLALGSKVTCIELQKAMGMGFRAFCTLETLRYYKCHVILAYCDMPFVSSESVTRLTEMHRQDNNTLSLISTYSTHLSGQIIRSSSGKVTEIIQQRLHSETNSEEKDVGFYLFKNTLKFRQHLANITNDNYRGEYYFADVIKQISNSDGKISAVNIPAKECITVNIPQELLKARLFEYIEHNTSIPSPPSKIGLRKDIYLPLKFFEQYGGIDTEEYVKNYTGDNLEMDITSILNYYIESIEKSIGSFILLNKSY